MKDPIEKSRAVEARLRTMTFSSDPRTFMDGAVTIAALCTALEAAQAENKLLHERHHFDNVAYTAAQKDAERLDYVQANSGYTLRKYKRRWSFKPFTNYEYEVFDTVREAIDAAIKAQGEET